MKILVVRYSSIGDIVLTTPVVRALKLQGGAEVHFLTKKNYASLVDHNPYVSKVHLIQSSNNEIIDELRREHFDYIIDLHHNLRTFILKRKLRVKSYSFDKQNIQKWLWVNFKINRLSRKHIVERYMDTLTALDIKKDGQGLDFFIPSSAQFNILSYIKALNDKINGDNYIACVIGGQFNTKKAPSEKWIQIINASKRSFILLGGKEDLENGKIIEENTKGNVLNLCGRLNLLQSAWFIKQAQEVITHDTGLMHIAAAFKKPIQSIWGNTVPAFGMTPYYGKFKDLNKTHQVMGLSCRPCSKIGYNKCPKGHFKCTKDIDYTQIIDNISL